MTNTLSRYFSPHGIISILTHRIFSQPAAPSGDPESTNAIDGQPKRKPKPKPVPKKTVRGKGKDTEVLASDNNTHASVNDHDVPEDTQQLESRRQPSVELDIRDTMQQVQPQIPESDTVAPVTSSSTAIPAIDPVSTSATSDNAPSDPTAVASSNEKENVHSLSSKGSTNGTCAMHTCPCRALILSSDDTIHGTYARLGHVPVAPTSLPLVRSLITLSRYHTGYRSRQ